MKKLHWRRAFLGLVVIASVAVYGDMARAQAPIYVTDYICSSCHAGPYGDYIQHGHRWMEVHVGGVTPPANLYSNPVTGAPVGVVDPGTGQTIGIALPDLSRFGLSDWSHVVDIVANFKEVDGSGASLLMDTGTFLESATSQIRPMPARCNNCHNTGGDPNGTTGTDTTRDPNNPPGSLLPKLTVNHAYGVTGIQGNWAVPGVECERCHGAGPTMMPYTGGQNKVAGNALCRDCHSSGDGLARDPYDTATPPPAGTPSYRIPFSLAAMQFNNHHPQGDEYRRSPHKNNTCYSCHDPHKSTWHDKGGLIGVPADMNADPGDMCLNCHSSKRIRGTMGQILVCADCHMPQISASGTRAAHLFRINPAPNPASAFAVTQPSDNSSPTVYWSNVNTASWRPTGDTTDGGDAAYTLDLVCTQCHGQNGLFSLQLPQMANYSPYIHNAFGLVDLTVNGSETTTGTNMASGATVRYTMMPSQYAGQVGTMYVLQYGPMGVMSWTGSRWVRGQVPLFRNQKLTATVDGKITLTRPRMGYYNFQVKLIPTAGQSSFRAVTGNVGLIVTR